VGAAHQKNGGGQCPPYTVTFSRQNMDELILRVKEAIEFWVEEMESVCAYDTAKACSGEIIPFEQAVYEIEQTLQDIYR
jgi:hypothetical protein